MAMSKEELLERIDEKITFAKNLIKSRKNGTVPEWEREWQFLEQIKHAITVFYNVIQPESRPIEESEIYQMGYEKGKEENQPEVDEEEFNAEAEKLLLRADSLKVLYDTKVYLFALFKKAGVKIILGKGEK